MARIKARVSLKNLDGEEEPFRLVEKYKDQVARAADREAAIEKRLETLEKIIQDKTQQIQQYWTMLSSTEARCEEYSRASTFNLERYKSELAELQQDVNQLNQSIYWKEVQINKLRESNKELEKALGEALLANMNLRKKLQNKLDEENEQTQNEIKD